MFFLIRMAFWFSLVLMVLPLDIGTDPNNGDSVSPIQAFFAAREAVVDVAAICERKPDVCETAGAAFSTIGGRAREGAKIAYEVLDERFGEPVPAVQTGGVAMPFSDVTDAIARN